MVGDKVHPLTGEIVNGENLVSSPGVVPNYLRTQKYHDRVKQLEAEQAVTQRTVTVKNRQPAVVEKKDPIQPTVDLASMDDINLSAPTDLSSIPLYSESKLGISPKDNLEILDYQKVESDAYTVEGFVMTSLHGDIWRVKEPNGKYSLIKIMDIDAYADFSQTKRMFELQTRAHKLLEENPHPNIVKVLKSTFIKNPKDVGKMSKNASYLPVFQLEDYEGKLLSEFPNAQIPVESKLMLLKQIASGMDHLHRNKILHCQFSPSSLAIDMNSQTAKLIEIGFAIDSNNTQQALGDFNGLMEGGFVSANLRSGGDPTPEDDLYSYASVVFYTLTGQEPFTSYDIENGNYLAQNLKSIETLMPNLLPHQVKKLNELFTSILCSNGLKTYNSAGKIAESVEKILNGKEPSNLLQRLFKG